MSKLLPRDQLQQLANQIQTFVQGCDPLANSTEPTPEADRLIQQVFQLQARHDQGYRRLCETRGIGPEDQPTWTEIPKVPTAAFKAELSHLEIGEDGAIVPPDALVFRSSGTTLGEAARSLHVNPCPDLYRSIIDVGYSAYCLPLFASSPSAGSPPPTLSLIPSLSQIGDSSLGFMAQHILQQHSDSDSAVAFSEAGVDLSAATAFLEDREVDSRPAMILTTAFALVELLDHLEERAASGDPVPALPAGSALFETGGFKGRSREITRAELVERTTRILGLPARSIVREYGMTELTSQMYSASLLGGDPELLCAPPWLAVSVFDPRTLEPVENGEVGLIGFFDLGNVGSYAAVLTEDLGRQHDEGLELLGRASQAELRGCSLTVEELQLAAKASQD